MVAITRTQRNKSSPYHAIPRMGRVANSLSVLAKGMTRCGHIAKKDQRRTEIPDAGAARRALAPSNNFQYSLTPPSSKMLYPGPREGPGRCFDMAFQLCLGPKAT